MNVLVLNRQGRFLNRQLLYLTAMTNEDKTIFMDEMTRLYLESKKNRRKW